MKFLAVISLCLNFTLAFAGDSETPKEESWTCTAMGTQNWGGPVGSQTMTVLGSGGSEADARQDAFFACVSRGLSMCSVEFCSKN